MLVRPMDINQPLANHSERIKGSRRPIDKLAVGSRATKAAFQNELFILARLQAVFRKEPGERSPNPGHIENGFHRAVIGSAADQRPVSVFAEHQIQSTNKNRFAGPGFTGDDVVAWL